MASLPGTAAAGRARSPSPARPLPGAKPCASRALGQLSRHPCLALRLPPHPVLPPWQLRTSPASLRRLLALCNHACTHTHHNHSLTDATPSPAPPAEWVRSYSSHEYLRLPAKAEGVLDETAEGEPYGERGVGGAALRCAALRCAALCCAVLCCAGLGWAGAGAGRCGRAALVVVVVVMGVVCVQPAWRCPGPSGRGFCCMLSGSGLQWLHGGCQPVQQQEGRKRREGGAKGRSRNREHRAQATVAEAIGGWRVQPRRLAQHSSSCSSRLGMPPLTGNRRPAAAGGQATAAAAGSRRGQSGGGGGVAGRSLAGMACRAMLPAPEAPCGRLASRHAAPGPLPALPCRLARDPAAALRSRPPLARLAPPRSAPFAQDARLVCGPCGGTGSRYCMHLPTHQPRRPRQGQAGGGSGHNHPHPPSVCRSSARFCSARRASPKQPPVCVCVCAPTSLWAHQRPFLQVHLQQRVVELFKKVFVLQHRLAGCLGQALHACRRHGMVECSALSTGMAGLPLERPRHPCLRFCKRAGSLLRGCRA